MAFFKKLKAVFGFGDEDSDEELNEKFLPYEAQHRTPYINPFKKEEATNKTMEENIKQGEEQTDAATTTTAAPRTANYELEELPMEMYNGVLAIINSTIPTFVRECLDVEAEKRAIAKALGPHIKNAMLKACRQIEEDARSYWDAERAEMANRIEQAEARGKEAIESAKLAQTKAASAEAQRKAVSERCHSLENRVAELEAECEQFSLENKSLVNKIKVAQVHADDAAHYREEAEELRRQIAELKEKPTAESLAEVEAKWSGEVAKLQQEIATKDADIDALAKKAEETASQLASTREELNEALATLDIANEVQEQVDKLSDQLKARDAKIAAMREQWDKKEAEAARNYNEVNNANLDLKLQYDLLKAEAQKLRDTLADAEKDKEDAIADLQQHLIKAEKDNEMLKNRIESLKEEAENAKKQSVENDSAREERAEDMKKQLEAAAMLIERRDATIKQLTDKVNAMEGEISYARVSDSENRLKIKQLTAELEKERSRSKDATEIAAEEQPAEEKQPVAEPTAPKKRTTRKTAKKDKTEELPSNNDVAMPEPELQEAIDHVFNISIDSSTPREEPTTNVADEVEEMRVVAEIPAAYEPVAEGESADEPQSAPQAVELPIDNTVKPPVEPIDAEPATALPGDEIDTTFTVADSDTADLDDDIEWLMPTASETLADEPEPSLPEGGDFVLYKKEEKPEKEEEPKQQQMSLF